MAYLGNNSKWLITQPDSLSPADNGTDISCLTMPMAQEGVDGQEIELEEPSSHANRCYFQRDGHVIEFAMSGTDWVELGTIPID